MAAQFANVFAHLSPAEFQLKPGEKLASPQAYSPGWRRLILWLVPLVSLAVYSNVFRVPFLLDDFSSIVENATIRSWSTALFPPPGGLTVSGRPIVNLSLAINYAISGYHPWSYHLFNIAIHVLSGWLLFGVVHRTANRWRATATQPDARSGRDSASASGLAAVVTLLWLVHPLQVESVTYIAQRAESLAGFFYLLALYGFIRVTEDPSRRRWAIVSVLAMTVGMATKEVMVTAPVVILLYDRYFYAGSFRQAWRVRSGFYLSYAATWLILGGLVLRANGRGGTAGFGLQVSPFAYALTQGEAIVRYLGLCVWPNPLVFDYGTHLTTNIGWSVVVVALLLATAMALYRGKIIGFLGGIFFLLLSPTSSFVPVTTQTMAEHRMYLALAVVITALVLACNYRFGRRGAPFFWMALVGLGATTYARNNLFSNPLLLWQQTVAERPENSRARYLLATELVNAGRASDAVAQVETAAKLTPDDPDARHNFAVILERVGRSHEAIAEAEAALRLQPNFVDAHVTLGNALVKVGRPSEGLEQFQRALQLEPNSSSAQNNRAGALMQLGRKDEALQAYASALHQSPADPLLHANLADALLQVGRVSEAAIEANTAIHFSSDLPVAHYILARALLRSDRAADARAEAETALRLQPNYVEAQLLLAELSTRAGLSDEALRRYTEALHSAPNSVEAHFNYANALLNMGRAAEAVSHYEAALHLKPDLAKAAYNLGHAWLQQSRWAEAADSFQAALRIEPDNLNARFNLGAIYLQTGKTAEAAAEFSEIVRRDPLSADGHGMLARAWVEAGHASAAIAEFETALRLKPGDADLQSELGQARLAAQREH